MLRPEIAPRHATGTETGVVEHKGKCAGSLCLACGCCLHCALGCEACDGCADTECGCCPESPFYAGSP